MGHKNELELMGFIKVALQATVFWKGILGKENSVTLSQKEYLTLGNVDWWLIQNGTWTLTKWGNFKFKMPSCPSFLISWMQIIRKHF